MKKVTVTVQYDEEKYKAVKMYLEKKGKNLDDEIAGYNRILLISAKHYCSE